MKYKRGYAGCLWVIKLKYITGTAFRTTGGPKKTVLTSLEFHSVRPKVALSCLCESQSVGRGGK